MVKKGTMDVILMPKERVFEAIEYCDKQRHFQQVVFSVYRNRLTQICWVCGKSGTIRYSD